MMCYVQWRFMFVFAAVMAANEPSNKFETNKNSEKRQQCSFYADSAPSQSPGLQSPGFCYAEFILTSIYYIYPIDIMGGGTITLIA